MKRIPLTQGQFALVDDEDFVRLSKHKWSAAWCRCTQSFYASRHSPRVNKEQRTIRMHREIVGAKHGEQVDHIDRDTLNNQRLNLRICSHQQNQANAHVRRNNTSGFKGISPGKHGTRWRANIGDGNGGRVYLGSYATREEAARAYDAASLRINGEFAATNAQLGLLPAEKKDVL